MRLVPAWVRAYRREWLRADLVAGLIIWSVVTPQAVAYAQIAGLPPAAGLVAAPGAMIGYALLGSSHTLVVSATTATSALSAAAVGPLADGDALRFAALSAALALLSGVVLALAGFLRLGALTDFFSKPVVTGFLFGLGLFIMVGQLPALLGVEGGDGNFFPQLGNVLGELGEVHAATLAAGAACLVLLLVLPRLLPRVPGVLVVLGLAIVVSALLGLDDHGVSVVGELPNALPDPAFPDIRSGDLTALLPAAFGSVVLGAESLGVARALATEGGYRVDTNRELYALGGANVLAGLSSGFIQSGGASQTAAAEQAGGRSELACVIAAGLILLTGAFLAPLFEPLPQAALAAIVIAAVAGFLKVAELRRFARIRSSALGFALVALVGVLVLGVLPGLLVAAALSLAALIWRLSRPGVAILARDPASGVWGQVDRHPDWTVLPDVLVTRVEGVLFYANAASVKERLLALVRAAPEPPRTLVLELAQNDVDLETVDMLSDLARALGAESVELRLASVRSASRAMLARAGVDALAGIEPTLDAAALGSGADGAAEVAVVHGETVDDHDVDREDRQ